MKNIKMIIQKRFKNFEFKKIVLYKNPNEFNHMYIEKINPTHVGLIWGRRKKSQNKGTNYIKCGKVFFSFIPAIMGLSTCAYIDVFTGYTYNILVNIGLLGMITIITTSLIIYILPFKIEEKLKCSVYLYQ